MLNIVTSNPSQENHELETITASMDYQTSAHNDGEEDPLFLQDGGTDVPEKGVLYMRLQRRSLLRFNARQQPITYAQALYLLLSFRPYQQWHVACCFILWSKLMSPEQFFTW